MKKILVLIVGLFFIAACSSSEILNLDKAKQLVQDYYENGSYNAECEKIIAAAEKELSSLSFQENSTVIFDIDDTVLSNYEYTKQLGFGYTQATYDEWINGAKFKAIPQVKEFYNWLLSKKIKIVFLTGRYSNTYEGTKRNLIGEGFTTYDTLIVRSAAEKKLPAAEYKSYKREELTKKGYKIIASIGDQVSDMKGKFVGIEIKLPNFLYGIE